MQGFIWYTRVVTKKTRAETKTNGSKAMSFLPVAFALARLIALGQTVAIAPREFEFKHHNNYELNKKLERIQSECPSITLLYELNYRSLKGWPLTVIEFSNNPGVHELRELLIKYNSVLYFCSVIHIVTVCSICAVTVRR